MILTGGILSETLTLSELISNNTALLEDFMVYLEVERNLSKHTLRAYTADIEHLLFWLKDLPVSQVNTNTIRLYLSQIQVFNYSKTTMARKIAAIRTFYRFLYRERIVDYNPADNIRSPKKPKKLPSFLNEDEVTQLFNIIEPNSPTTARNRAILEVLYACGMRVSELCGLNFGNLNLEIIFIKEVLNTNIKPKTIKVIITIITPSAKAQSNI